MVTESTEISIFPFAGLGKVFPNSVKVLLKKVNKV